MHLSRFGSRRIESRSRVVGKDVFSGEEPQTVEHDSMLSPESRRLPREPIGPSRSRCPTPDRDSRTRPQPDADGHRAPQLGQLSVRRTLLGQAAAIDRRCPRPARVIDSFLLEEAIGVGGMGAVFRGPRLPSSTGRSRSSCSPPTRPPIPRSSSDSTRRADQPPSSTTRISPGSSASARTGRSIYIAFEYIEGETIRQRVEATGPLPVRRGRGHRAPDRQCPGPRVTPRRGPSRHQAVEHHPDAAGPRQAGRHGPGPPLRARRRPRADPERHDARHIRLHQPRAGPRPARRGRPQRPLLARAARCSTCSPAGRRSLAAPSSRS